MNRPRDRSPAETSGAEIGSCDEPDAVGYDLRQIGTLAAMSFRLALSTLEFVPL